MSINSISSLFNGGLSSLVAIQAMLTAQACFVACLMRINLLFCCLSGANLLLHCRYAFYSIKCIDQAYIVMLIILERECPPYNFHAMETTSSKPLHPLTSASALDWLGVIPCCHGFLLYLMNLDYLNFWSMWFLFPFAVAFINLFFVFRSTFSGWTFQAHWEILPWAELSNIWVTSPTSNPLNTLVSLQARHTILAHLVDLGLPFYGSPGGVWN